MQVILSGVCALLCCCVDLDFLESIGFSVNVVVELAFCPIVTFY